MKVVVDALLYETAMCSDKEITSKVRGATLSQTERLEIILAELQTSGYAASQRNGDRVVWLPKESAFGRSATKHKLTPDSWEAANVHTNDCEAESYALVLRCAFEESVTRSVENTKAFFEMLNWDIWKCRLSGRKVAGSLRQRKRGVDDGARVVSCLWRGERLEAAAGIRLPAAAITLHDAILLTNGNRDLTQEERAEFHQLPNC